MSRSLTTPRLTAAAVAGLPDDRNVFRGLRDADEISVDETIISHASVFSDVSFLRANSIVSSASTSLSSTSSSIMSCTRSLHSPELVSKTNKRKYNMMNRHNAGARDSDDRNKKRKKLLSEESIASVLTTSCCSKSCLRHLTFEAVEAMRNRYIPLLSDQKNTAILQTIKLALSKYGNDCRRLLYRVEVAGLEVCGTALQHLYGVGQSTLTKLIALARTGTMISYTMPATRERAFCWIQVVRHYVQLFAERFGSPMPNSDKIELPVGTKRQIYLRFKVHVEGLNDCPRDPCTESWFYSVWKRECSNIIVPKTCSFAKCDHCTKFKKELTDSKNNFAQRKQIVVEFDEHLNAQMMERNEYYRKRAHARNYPDECMSLICDGMQQKTTILPHFRYAPKDLWAATKIQAHVVGVLDHGQQPQAYIHDPTVGGGPNLIMQCVWNAMLHTLKSRGKLPPLLYLQLDNTSGENKNHWVFEFASFLVENGYFEEVITCLIFLVNIIFKPFFDVEYNFAHTFCVCCF